MGLKRRRQILTERVDYYKHAYQACSWRHLVRKWDLYNNYKAALYLLNQIDNTNEHNHLN